MKVFVIHLHVKVLFLSLKDVHFVLDSKTVLISNYLYIPPNDILLILIQQNSLRSEDISNPRNTWLEKYLEKKKEFLEKRYEPDNL